MSSPAPLPPSPVLPGPAHVPPSPVVSIHDAANDEREPKGISYAEWQKDPTNFRNPLGIVATGMAVLFTVMALVVGSG